jgi:hypothetical protein
MFLITALVLLRLLQASRMAIVVNAQPCEIWYVKCPLFLLLFDHADSTVFLTNKLLSTCPSINLLFRSGCSYCPTGFVVGNPNAVIPFPVEFADQSQGLTQIQCSILEFLGLSGQIPVALCNDELRLMPEFRSLCGCPALLLPPPPPPTEAQVSSPMAVPVATGPPAVAPVVVVTGPVTGPMTGPVTAPAPPPAPGPPVPLGAPVGTTPSLSSTDPAVSSPATAVVPSAPGGGASSTSAQCRYEHYHVQGRWWCWFCLTWTCAWAVYY